MPSAMKLNVRRNNAGDTAPHRIDRCNHSSTPAHRSGLGALQAHHLTHGRTFQRAGRRVDGGASRGGERRSIIVANGRPKFSQRINEANDKQHEA